MEIKACIFDLDGTSADTLYDIADNVNRALEKFGFKKHECEEYRYFMGHGVDDMIRAALPDDRRDNETVDKVRDTYQALYKIHYLDETKPFDGIHELFEKLTEMGIKINVLSNKTETFTKNIIKTLFADIRFEYILGNVDYLPLKPNPESSLFIAKELNILPENFLFIGDSDVDMQTAKNAGMHGVGAVWGFRTPEELKENGAEFLAAHPIDIVDIIKNNHV